MKASTPHPLNIDLVPGDVLWVRGGNGSGKSSLLKTIAGLLPHDSGDIAMNGVASYLPHQLGLYDDLNVAAHDAYWGAPEGEFYTQNRKCLVGALSMGQKKKVALDYFFNTCGDILLLDEPFSNLDQAAQLKLNDHLKSLRDKIILIAEHHEFDCYTALLDLDVCHFGV